MKTYEMQLILFWFVVTICSDILSRQLSHFCDVLAVWNSRISKQVLRVMYKYSLPVRERQIYIVKFWTCAPPPVNFFHFHAVFRKNWPNNRSMTIGSKIRVLSVWDIKFLSPLPLKSCKHLLHSGYSKMLVWSIYICWNSLSDENVYKNAFE